MATDQALQQLYATLDKLQKVDTAKLLRKNLGDESLDSNFSPKLAEIGQLSDFVRVYARAVHDDSVNQARGTFENVANLMTQQAARPAAEYIGQRETFLSQAESHLRDSQRWRPAFVCAAVEERGFLSLNSATSCSRSSRKQSLISATPASSRETAMSTSRRSSQRTCLVEFLPRSHGANRSKTPNTACSRRRRRRRPRHG